MKTEVLGNLKNLGNMFLGKFGMSLDNFKLNQNDAVKMGQENGGGDCDRGRGGRGDRCRSGRCCGSCYRCRSRRHRRSDYGEVDGKTGRDSV